MVLIKVEWICQYLLNIYFVTMLTKLIGVEQSKATFVCTAVAQTHAKGKAKNYNFSNATKLGNFSIFLPVLTDS